MSKDGRLALGKVVLRVLPVYWLTVHHFPKWFMSWIDKRTGAWFLSGEGTYNGGH